MTTLGNIYSSYGKAFNIAIANTYSNIVLSGNNLPENTIIISAPVDDKYEDIGTYSLLVTDNNGSPVRLTYTIKQGNGLVEDINDKDTLYLYIDDKYIKDNEGLYINLSDIVSDTIYVNENNRLCVNTNKLKYSSSDNKGIVSVDGNTVKTDDDIIYINTEELNLANNSAGQYGIIAGGDSIINIDNGIISLNEDNLPLASDEDYGICKGDEYTVSVKGDSSLKVNTEHLNKATNDNYGIISVDNDKINSENGILKVNTDNLHKGNYVQKGIIGIDNNTITLNEDKQISVTNYENIVNDISYLVDSFNDISQKLNDLKEDILSQING